MQYSLKALRVNAGLTQANAAKALNVSRNTVSKWERGETFPDAKKLKSLCELYRCNIGDIFVP